MEVSNTPPIALYIGLAGYGITKGLLEVFANPALVFISGIFVGLIFYSLFQLYLQLHPWESCT